MLITCHGTCTHQRRLDIYFLMKIYRKRCLAWDTDNSPSDICRVTWDIWFHHGTILVLLGSVE